MKCVAVTENVKLPADVQVKINGRKVYVEGPRGKLMRDFSHSNINIVKVSRKCISVTVYFGNKRQVQCVNTVKSSINNMITGVTKGFRYIMKLVYAHYPINIVISADKKSLEVRNYIGQKLTRFISIPDGVSVYMGKVKDEVVIEGNDVELVSKTVSQVNQCARVHNRDIRKFLDGIYVYSKTNVTA